MTKYLIASELKAVMARHDITVAQLASVLGLSTQGLYSKLNGRARWFVGDAIAITGFINTTQDARHYTVDELFGENAFTERMVEGEDN